MGVQILLGDNEGAFNDLHNANDAYTLQIEVVSLSRLIAQW